MLIGQCAMGVGIMLINWVELLKNLDLSPPMIREAITSMTTTPGRSVLDRHKSVDSPDTILLNQQKLHVSKKSRNHCMISSPMKSLYGSNM